VKAVSQDVPLYFIHKVLQGSALVTVAHGVEDLLDYVIAIEGERALLYLVEVYHLLDQTLFLNKWK
jgi:hypothetical protein